MRYLPALLLSTTLLTACQQGASYEENQNTYKGAGLGAIIGGAIGALSDDDDRLKHGGIGAGVGAGLGGLIGQYMDSQEREMRQATAGTGIDVTRQGNDLYLNMPSNITFATDSSFINHTLRPTLDNVSNILVDYPDTIVEIIGNTDDTGAAEYNLELSDRRAESVENFLRNNGVSQRMITTGAGESNPIATNTTASGRAENRRVEVKISPISK